MGAGTLEQFRVPMLRATTGAWLQLTQTHLSARHKVMGKTWC